MGPGEHHHKQGGRSPKRRSWAPGGRQPGWSAGDGKIGRELGEVAKSSGALGMRREPHPQLAHLPNQPSGDQGRFASR